MKSISSTPRCGQVPTSEDEVEMRRLFPDKDPVSMLRTNRGFLNSVQNLGSLSRADHLMGGVGRGGVDYW